MRKVVLGCCWTRFFPALRMTKGGLALISAFATALLNLLLGLTKRGYCITIGPLAYMSEIHL
jgi:polyferredoxin